MGGHALVTLEHAPTLPLSAVLQQLAVKSQQHGIDLSKTKAMLNVDLSAGVCKGIVVPASFKPSQISNMPSNMHPALAAQLPWPPEQWAWPSGAAVAGVLPITTQGLMRNLRAWMQTKNIKIGVVQPLWAGVTQSSRATPSSTKGVMLHEPDGITVLKGNQRTQTAEQRAIWQFLPSQETAADAQSLQDAKASLTLNDSEVAIFQFHSRADFADEPGFKAWAGHWGQR